MLIASLIVSVLSSNSVHSFHDDVIRHLRIKTVTVTELELRLKSSHKSGSSQNQTY